MKSAVLKNAAVSSCCMAASTPTSCIARAMQPGYSTASEEAREMGFGAGMGLPNMKNNSDDIRIECAPGQGTRVHMMFLYEAERGIA